jgi:hypothetical protein
MYKSSLTSSFICIGHLCCIRASTDVVCHLYMYTAISRHYILLVDICISLPVHAVMAENTASQPCH